MTLACIPATDPSEEFRRRVEAVRRFNRFYTQKIGLLRDRAAWAPFTITQARVLYELAHGASPTAAVLAADLGLDQGYMSRILAEFSRRRLVAKSRHDSDGRAQRLALTAKGRAALAPVDARAHAEVAAILERCSDADQGRVLDAMRVIEETLGEAPRRAESFVLRQHRPGDLGWIVERHGAVYAAEQNWDGRFEALVAAIVAEFGRAHDAARERCFIAERRGENVGSALLVAKSKNVARLRLLLVEPQARGRGLGARLVDECVRFARDAGYARVTLWTAAELVAARRLYERAGFRLVRSEAHEGFGRPIDGQTWEVAT